MFAMTDEFTGTSLNTKLGLTASCGNVKRIASVLFGLNSTSHSFDEELITER